jgi:nucleotide-binding universal stress UspA family protein
VLKKTDDGSEPPSVTVRAVTGRPGEELLSAATDADMIVVGARGGGGFKRLLLGSVSTQLTHHAHCPVVVIPGDNI